MGLSLHLNESREYVNWMRTARLSHAKQSGASYTAHERFMTSLRAFMPAEPVSRFVKPFSSGEKKTFYHW
jgi:hypothetical protein